MSFQKKQNYFVNQKPQTGKQRKEQTERNHEQENANVERVAKQIKANAYKAYTDISEIFKGKSLSKNFFDPDLLDEFQKVFQENKDNISKASLNMDVQSSVDSIERLFATFAIPYAVSKKRDRKSALTAAKAFGKMVYSINLNLLSRELSTLQPEQITEISTSIYKASNKASDKKFATFLVMLYDKVLTLSKENPIGRPTPETQQDDSFAEEEIEESQPEKNSGELDPTKALQIQYEKQYFELNRPAQETANKLNKELQEVLRTQGEEEMKKYLINRLRDTEVVLHNNIKMTHPVFERLTVKQIDNIEVRLFSHPKVNEIAGEVVERVAINFKSKEAYRKAFPNEAAEGTAGFAFPKKIDDQKVRLFISSESVSQDSFIDLHEMLHCIDPYIETRSGPDGVLTEILAYSGQYDTLDREAFIKNINNRVYSKKFGMKDLPKEYPLIVDTLLDHAEALEAKYGHIDMLRIVAMSPTIQKFLEKE